MAMGHYAAVNTHEHILSSLCGTAPKYIHWPEVPPMIALAIGHQSIMYSPADGIKTGEDVAKMMFGDDLGLTSELFVDPSRTKPELTRLQYVRTICSLGKKALKRPTVHYRQ
jgi:hypothetical protein